MLVLFAKRRERMLTQLEVALSMKPRVSQGLVSQWECNQSKPSPEHLEQLGQLFGVVPDDLFIEYEDYIRRAK